MLSRRQRVLVLSVFLALTQAVGVLAEDAKVLRLALPDIAYVDR